MTKKLKAYNYTWHQARRRGFKKVQWSNSVRSHNNWVNQPQLKKEIQYDILKKARQVKQVKKGVKPIGNEYVPYEEEYVEVYEISSQSHHDTHDKFKRPTKFQYSTSGFFENEPNIDTLEKMTKNSLISAFNSGKTGQKGYLKKNLFNKLVDNNLRGFKVDKIKVKKSDITLNRMSAQIEINKAGNKWKGRN